MSLRKPLAGMYQLTVFSDCPPPLCLSVYPTLVNASFAIQVVPGVPFELVMVTAPPAYIEHGFVVKPPPRLQALDVSGNLCTNTNTFAAVSFAPTVQRVAGGVTPLIAGVASFDQLVFYGERGVVYTLTFTVPSLPMPRARLGLLESEPMPIPVPPLSITAYNVTVTPPP